MYAQGPLEDCKIWHSTDVTLLEVGMQLLEAFYYRLQLIIEEDMICLL